MLPQDKLGIKKVNFAQKPANIEKPQKAFKIKTVCMEDLHVLNGYQTQELYSSRKMIKQFLDPTKQTKNNQEPLS